MAWHFHICDYLIIELNTKEIYEGEYVDGSANRIDLINVKQNNNKNKLNGIYSFYKNEVTSVHKCEEKKKKFDQNIPKDECKVESVCRKILIEDEEYGRLRQMTTNYIYMENSDIRYFEACNKLLETETVGVVALGMEIDRSAFINLLVISTWKQVYIFDLSHLKQRKFPPELKDILESYYTTKVIHNAAHTVDCLYKMYKINMQNVFDTQVVDLVIAKRETGKSQSNLRNLSECLTHFFNFPPSLVKAALEVSCKKWKRRPLSEKRKEYAAQLGAYLFVLKDCMQKILLKDVFTAIDNVHMLYMKSGDYEFKNRLHERECTKDIDDLIPKMSQSLTVVKEEAVLNSDNNA